MKKKYLVLIFSDNNGKPSKEFIPTGVAGFRHNEMSYLEKLPSMAKYLNRTVVLPPPWVCLERRHNNFKPINKNHTWSTYLNIDTINNLEKNPPFSYINNGDIVTDLLISYYPSYIPLDRMDNTVDIIALTNYNDKISGFNIYSPLMFSSQIKYSTSNLLKSYADIIISKLNLD